MENEADSEGDQEIWGAENFYTISLFIEHTDDGDYLVWYLEAESMDQLISARDSSTHPLNDLEDEMMEEALESPDAVGDSEPRMHGMGSDRANDFVV